MLNSSLYSRLYRQQGLQLIVRIFLSQDQKLTSFILSNHVAIYLLSRDDVTHLLSPQSEGEESDEDASHARQEADEETTKEQVDIRYLMPNHIPQYMRIDKDIKDGLYRLTELMKDYSNFDVLALERDVTRTLELELDKQSADYKRHNRTTEKRLTQAQEKLEQCIVLKDEIIQTRVQEITQTKQTYEACRNF